MRFKIGYSRALIHKLFHKTTQNRDYIVIQIKGIIMKSPDKNKVKEVSKIKLQTDNPLAEKDEVKAVEKKQRKTSSSKPK